MERIKTSRRPIVWLVLVTFLFNTVISQPVQADVPFLPAVGKLISLTPSFSPSMILGLKVFKNNPFKFEFVMSQGDKMPNENSLSRKIFLKEEAGRLVKYFLASLTVPEKDMWVNLSPYDNDRIIPKAFGITEMGKEMLAQDYLLKQVTASVMYPEGDTGKEFWRKIYQEAYKRFGTTNIPVNTFNKVWILPDKAVVYENAVDNTAVIVKSRLKVMLEEDYLALNKSTLHKSVTEDLDANRKLSNELIRKVILPLIEKEVNTGKNFANLRQVYNSLILAFWYKNKLKESLIGKGYVDREKTHGIDVEDKNIDQEIYKQYLRSYKKGVYNYIKEDVDPLTQETIPRKYFSGGIVWGNLKEEIVSGRDPAQMALKVLESGVVMVDVGLKGKFNSGTHDIDLNGITSTTSVKDAAMSRAKNFKVKKLAVLAVGLSLFAGATMARAQGPQQDTVSRVGAVVENGVGSGVGPVVTPAASKTAEDLRNINRITAEITETFDIADNGSRILDAFVHPVTREFSVEKKALDGYLSDPDFAKGLPNQAELRHSLDNLGAAAGALVDNWNDRPGKGHMGDGHKLSQSVSNLRQSLNNTHTLLNEVNNQVSSQNTPVPVKPVPPSPQPDVQATAPVKAATIAPVVPVVAPAAAVVTPAAASKTSDDLKNINKITADVTETFDIADNGSRILDAFVHNQPQEFRAEEKTINGYLSDPDFAKGLPNQGELRHSLANLGHAAGALVDNWNDRPGKGHTGAGDGRKLSQSVSNLRQSINNTHTLLNQVNNQVNSKIASDQKSSQSTTLDDYAKAPIIAGAGGPPPPPKINLDPNLSQYLNTFFSNVTGALNSDKLANQLLNTVHNALSAEMFKGINNYHWAFSLADKDHITAATTQPAVAPSLEQYNNIKNQFNQVTPANPNVQNSDHFAQDVRNDNNWKTLQDTLLSDSAPYFVIVNTDKNNMYSINRTFNKYQGGGSGHDPDSYMDFVYGNGFDQNGQANVSFKIRVPPKSTQGKVDISTIDTWESIDSPEKIDQWQLDHKNIYVQAVWKDKDGKQQSGVVYGSHKAAQIAQDFMFSALRDRIITQKLMTILGTPDYDQQAKMIGLPINPNQPRGDIFVGARVERDEFGFITKVVDYIHARDIGVKVSKLPFDHQDIVISQEGKNPRVIEYWPYAASQVIKTYSFLTDDEQNRLNDPNMANASFNTYLNRDGNPLKRGEIIMGNNTNIRNLIDVKTQELLAQNDIKATKQYKKYLDQKIPLNILFSAANVGISFTGLNASVNSAGNMIFDLIERPDQIGRFVPTEKELQKVFDEYNASQPEKDRFVLTQGSLQTVKGFYTEDDMTKLSAYLNNINDEKTKFFFLNQVSMAAEIASHYLPSKTATSGIYQFQVPQNQALYDVLSQRYVSFTGELNIPNVLSLLSRGQATQFVSLKEMAGSASFLDKLTSIIGVTVDLKSVVNEVNGRQIFPLAPSKTRFNFYILGFPLSLINEDELVGHIDTILNDNVSDIFIVEDGHFKSVATAFNTKEFRSLYKTVQAIPVGKVSKIGIDGRPLEVPVYEIEIITPSGEHIKKVAIYTLKALRENEMNVRYDLERYENYTKSLTEGGVVLHFGSNGGTFDQNIYTGLFESFNQQGAIGFPSAYTFDQGEADLFFIKTGNLQPVERNLDFFLNVMQAQLKMGKFQGMGKSYNAYTGDAVDRPDIAGTCMIAQTIMAYENRTGNPKYGQLLHESIKWLEEVQKANGGHAFPNTPGSTGKYAEPNAIAYAVLYNHGTIYKDRQALAAAENIRQWAANLWDNDHHLIKVGEGENAFSSDAQTRWFLALGPQQFMHTFLKDNPQELGQFLQAVEKTFGVDVMNYHSGATVRLLDLADENKASHRLTNMVTTETMRIGFPEVTSEFVQALKEAKPYLTGDDVQFADTTIKTYSDQLTKMADKNGNLPQATIANEDTAFNGRTVVGRFALAAAAQYQLSVVLGENILRIGSNHYGNDLGLVPAQVNIPPQLSFEELNQGGRVKAGEEVYEAWKGALSGMIEKDKQQHNPNLLFYDPLNNQEVVFVDDQGRIVHAVLIPPQEKISRQADLTRQNLEMNMLMNQAENGEGEFARGGVIFQTPQGQRIGTLQNSKMVDEVLKAISKLPIQEQSFINFKQYSNFMLHGFKVDGHVQDVTVTLVFPMHKVITADSQDAYGLITTSIIEDGLVRLMVNDQVTTVFNYDAVTGVEASTKSYANVAATREAMVKILEDKQSLDERRAVFSDKIPLEETTTVWAGYTDPTLVSIDSVDPNKVKIIKRAVNTNTGNITTQSYGLFTRPVWEADQFYVTENHFDNMGRFTYSEQYRNIGTISDPKKGEKLFENNAFDVNGGRAIPITNGIDLAGQGGAWIYQKDIAHDTTQVRLFDNHNFGRSIATFSTDVITGTDNHVSQLNMETVLRYQPEFFGGRIPSATSGYAGPAQDLIELKSTTTSNYDPMTGHMEAADRDLHTGAVVTEAFVRGTSNPIEVRNLFGTTRITYNDNETSFTAKTVTNDTGELTSTKSGEYNLALHQWGINAILYHQYIQDGSPNNIIERKENSASSALGHLINVDSDNLVRSIPQYDLHGVETGRHSLLSQNGAYTIPFHVFGDYHWSAGVLTQTVDTGTPLSHQETLDVTGRSTNETYGSSTVKVAIDKTYEGGTQRLKQTAVTVNGVLRDTVAYGAAHLDLNNPSAWIQPTTVTPVFGLTHTEDYKIGDIFGRPFNILYANGSTLVVDQWVENSNRPRATHVVNHNGRTIARDQSDKNFVNKDGLFLMPIHHSEYSFFGTAQETGEKAFIAGTAIPYYSVDNVRQEITYLDLTKPFESPLYTQDTTGQFNVPMMINGKEIPVTGIHWTELGTTYSGDNNGYVPEKALIDTLVHFDGHHAQSIVRTVFDIAANPLEVKSGAIVAPVKGGYNYETIKAAAQASANDSIFITKNTLFYTEGGFVLDNGAYKFTSVKAEAPNTVNNNDIRDHVTSTDVYENRYPIGGSIRPNYSLTASLHALSRIDPNAVQASIQNAYIDSNGVIQANFDPTVQNFVLPGISDSNKKRVHDTLIWRKASQERNPVYNGTNPWISMSSPWWVTKDIVTYTTDDKGNPQEVDKMSAKVWSESSGRQVFTYNTGLGLNKKPIEGFNYTLPKQTSVLLHSMGAVAAQHEMGGLTVPALKGSDFLYFYSDGLKGANVTLVLTDSNGKQVRISDSSTVKFWTPMASNKIFITKAIDPQQIITIDSSRVDMRDKNIWVVSIPQIVQSGLINAEGSLTASLSIEGSIDPHAVVSPMGVLGNGAHQDLFHVETTNVDKITWGEDGKTVSTHVTDPKGRGNTIIETFGPNTSKIVSSDADLWAPDKTSPSSLLDNSSQNPEFTIFKDPARPNVAISFWRPSGYVVSGVSVSYKDEHNGSFVFRLGARNGFESPSTMKFALGYMRSDLPEAIAYGADQFVVFPMGEGVVLGNMNANIFNKSIDLARHRDNPHFELSAGQKEFLKQYSQAPELAKIINDFPLANEAGAEPRPFWEENRPNAPSPIQRASVQINGQNLKSVLQQLIGQKQGNEPPLLATGLGVYSPANVNPTEFVESTKELEYVVPALIRLNMVPEAQKIIQFYLEKTQNGSLSIADSYSSKTGESAIYNSELQKAAPSPRSASSQIAFINSLLFLGEATDNPSYNAYAETALAHLLMDHNPSLHNSPTMSLANIHGGITEQKANTDIQPRGGIQLLPVNPDSFSTVSNTKFYLLLNKIINDPRMNASLLEKARTLEPLQKEWLKTSGLFDRLHRDFQSGIEPDSFNDLYDLQGVERNGVNNPKVLGANPWATFESSRYVLEAAYAAKEITPKELEDLLVNITRYYHRQVTIDGHPIDGFDSIVRPIGRQDLIVPENMSELLFLAKLAGNQPLAGKINAVIDTYPLINGLLPEIISGPSTSKLGLDSGTTISGTMYRFLPNADQTGWPGSLSTTIGHYFSQEGISPYSSIIGKDNSMLSILSVAGGYILLKTLATVIPKVVYGPKRRLAKLMAKGKYDLRKRVFSPELRDTADKRFKERVLKTLKKEKLFFQGNGAIKPRQLEATVLSDAHVEGLFLYHSNLIRYLATERVRRENNWNDDDPRLRGDNPYLNSIDDLMLTLFALMRQEIAKGDDLQIQGKLEAFLQNYYFQLKASLISASQDNDYSKFDSIMKEIVGNFGLPSHPLDDQFNKEIQAENNAKETHGAITYQYTEHVGITPLMIKRFTHDFYAKYDAFVKKERLTSIAPAMMEMANYFDRFILLSLTSIFSMSLADQNENPFTLLANSFLLNFGTLGIAAAAGTAIAVLASIILEVRAQFKHARPNPAIARPLGVGLLIVAGVLGYSLSNLSFEASALKWLISGSLAVEGLSLFNNVLLSHAYALIKGLIYAPMRLIFFLVHPIENKKTYSMLIHPRALVSTIKSKSKELQSSLSSHNRSPHSLFGLSLYFHLKPAISMGPWYMLANYALYLPLSMVIAAFAGHEFNIYNWFSIRYLAGQDLKVAVGALTYVLLIQYLAPYSIFAWLTAVFSAGRSVAKQLKLTWYKFRGQTLSKKLVAQIAEAKENFHQPILKEEFLKLTHGAESLRALMDLQLGDIPVLEEVPAAPTEVRVNPQISLREIEGAVRALENGDKIWAILERSNKKIGLMNYGGNSIVSPVFLLKSVPKATEEILKYYDVLKANGDKSPKITMSREEAKDALDALHTAEQNAGLSLFHLVQLNNSDLPPELRITVEDPREADKVAQGYRLRIYLSEQLAATANMNIAANFVAKAIEVRKFGIGDNFVFYIGHNKLDAPPSATSPSKVWKDNIEIEQRDKLAMLLRKISGNAEVQYVHTHFGMKSGGMNSLFLSEEFKKLRWFFVEDRNATTSDMQRWFSDLTTIVKDDNLSIIVANRDTTYKYNPLGAASFLVEQGFVSNGPQKVSTGWGTMQQMTYEDSLNMHSYENTPVMPLTGATSDLQKNMGLNFFQRFYNNLFGLIGFTVNSTGQSEDYQSLLATVHTMIAMGANPKYAFSEALWTKVRESNYMTAWANAVPRWSAGRLQTIDDYLMQNINELGPESSFARDYNINHGRFYITMPLAIVTIFLAPLSVYFDLTPFQGIQGLFWSFGFGAAHVSILHGILSTLRFKGYNRAAGIVGAGVALAAAAYFLPVDPVVIFGIAIPKILGVALSGIAGLVSSGFIVGIADSISRFVRDKILFSNRISIERGGQIKGHEGINFEFKMSGGGDNVFTPFGGSLGIFYNQKSRKLKIFSDVDNDKQDKHVLNPVTINHSILLGTIVTGLNILVMFRLDLVNAFMLLPSLIFTTGMVVGPIMMKKKIGKETVFGDVFKIFGFLQGAVFLAAVSVLARVLTLEVTGNPVDQGDKQLIIAGMMMAGIVNLLPVIREFIAWTKYRNVPDKAITLERLGKSFNIKDVSKEYKKALQKYRKTPRNTPDEEMNARKELDDAYKVFEDKVTNVLDNGKESKIAKWLFLGKFARITSEQARGFWSAIITLGWLAIVPIPSMLAVSFAEYKFAVPAETVVAFIGYATVGIASVQVLGKTVNWLETLYWRTKVNNLHKEVNTAFGATYISGKYSYRQNEIEALMMGIDIFMEQRSFTLIRQGYNDVKELLKSGDGRDIFINAPGAVPAVATTTPAVPATAPVVPAQVPTNFFTDIASRTDRAMQAGEVNPGGIDFSNTAVSVDTSGGSIKIAFDDPAMLRLLLKADGLAPIIYDVKAMTPSMANHFVGLDY